MNDSLIIPLGIDIAKAKIDCALALGPKYRNKSGVSASRRIPMLAGHTALTRAVGLCARDHEQAREREQHRAVAARRHRLRDRGPILGEECFALIGIERREVGLQRRALEPFDHGVVTVQRVVIGGAPEIDARAQRSQQIEVPQPVVPVRMPHAADAVRPSIRCRDGLRDAMRRLGQVVRHLHGQTTTFSQLRQQMRIQRRVIR